MNKVINFGDKDLHTEESTLVPIAVYAVVRYIDNGAGIVAIFRDTHREADQWLKERFDKLQSRDGLSAKLENHTLTTKGESVVFPDSVIVYRIEGISLAMALNYLLERGLGYERIS